MTEQFIDSSPQREAAVCGSLLLFPPPPPPGDQERVIDGLEAHVPSQGEGMPFGGLPARGPCARQFMSVSSLDFRMTLGGRYS